MKTAHLRRKRVILPAIAAVVALGAGGVVWSSAANADLQGGERDRVGAAATAAVGGGTVLDAESSDDRGEAYEVEVRKDDGTTVDVTLDEQLRTVGQDADDRTGLGTDESTDSTDSTDSTEDNLEDRTDDRTDVGDRTDRALSAAERASAEKAALRAVDGGKVTQVEAGDDRGEAYEVQVLKGTTEWDVELDAGFKVLRKTADN